MDTYKYKNHQIEIREATVEEKMSAASQHAELNILEKLWIILISGPRVNCSIAFPGGKGDAIKAAMDKIV